MRKRSNRHSKTKTVTIDDIALLAGVSRSTVSRVLTDSKNVKAETERKIRKAMKELDYHPNVLARGLATGTLNLVTMLMSEPEQPFYLQLMAKMDRELRARGYILNLCYLGGDEDARRETFRAIQEYGSAGLIVGDILNEPSLVEEIGQSRRPLVFFNRYVEALSDFDSVITDNYFGGYLAGKHLLELGHRRMAMLTGPLNSLVSRDRYNGFRDALAESGLELPGALVEEGELTLESGVSYAESFFRGKRKCTAVFMASDVMAIGFLFYCRKHDISVPDTVSVVGFDDLRYAGSELCELTTIRQPYEQMGAVAVDLLVDRIQGGCNAPHQHILLEPRLIIRGSSGAV